MGCKIEGYCEYRDAEILDPINPFCKIKDCENYVPIRFCPENCPSLDPKEEEQNLYIGISRMGPHRCTKYDVRLFHGKFHPQIIRCDQCLEAYKNKIKTFKEEKK